MTSTLNRYQSVLQTLDLNNSERGSKLHCNHTGSVIEACLGCSRFIGCSKAKMVNSSCWLKPRHQSQKMVDGGGRGFPGHGGEVEYVTEIE